MPQGIEFVIETKPRFCFDQEENSRGEDKRIRSEASSAGETARSYASRLDRNFPEH